jgi:hypothetical protein
LREDGNGQREDRDSKGFFHGSVLKISKQLHFFN